MARPKRLSASDHGRAMTWEDFLRALGRDGYQFEYIDGKVYVWTTPEVPYHCVVMWLLNTLLDYSKMRPDGSNVAGTCGCVFVPDPPTTSITLPDVVAYSDYPHHLPLGEVRYQDLKPTLVAEIVTPDDPDKDLVRNVELYESVPS